MKNFLEFEVKYDIEKIKKNYAMINCNERSVSYMKFGKWKQINNLKKLFSENALRIKIIENSNNRFTHHEKEKIKNTLLEYIVVSILNDIPDKGQMSMYDTICTKKASLSSDSISDNEIMEMLGSIRQIIFNSNSKFGIYQIKEKAEQSDTTISEKDKTVLYSVGLISMNEPQSQESYLELFNIAIGCWMEYFYFTMNPVFFMNINDEFDKKELCKLKLLYELKTSEGVKLVDYGFQYAYKQAEAIEIISMSKNYKTINELVKKAKYDYNVAITAKKTNILMSIKNSESDILLERKVTAYYIELLLMINLLCEIVDPKYIDLLGLRDVGTIEDLYDMCNCVHAGLKKIELELTKSMNLLKENRELAQDEIEEKTKIYEKKIEAVQAAIKHFDTWKIEEEEIKKLHSFQSEYIMEKLRTANFIKYPWPQYVEESKDFQPAEDVPIQSSADIPLEFNLNTQEEDPQPTEVKSAWLNANRLVSVIFIVLKILFAIAGIMVFLYKKETAGSVDISL